MAVCGKRCLRDCFEARHKTQGTDADPDNPLRRNVLFQQFNRGPVALFPTAIGNDRIKMKAHPVSPFNQCPRPPVCAQAAGPPRSLRRSQISARVQRPGNDKGICCSRVPAGLQYWLSWFSTPAARCGRCRKNSATAGTKPVRCSRARLSMYSPVPMRRNRPGAIRALRSSSRNISSRLTNRVRKGLFKYACSTQYVHASGQPSPVFKIRYKQQR